MSDPVVEIVSLDTLAEAVMADVKGEIPQVTWEVSTSAIPSHGSSPRVIWVPSRDRWGAGQKLPRGGGSTGKALATVMAGVDLHCWGATRLATWELVHAVARALLRRVGWGPSLSIDGGQWLLSAGNQTAQGDAYILSIAVAIDVPALPAPRTVTITSTPIDNTHSVTGDGFTDAGETG